MTGWTQAEATGRSLPEVFHIINEHTRKHVDNPVTNVLAEGVVVGLAWTSMGGDILFIEATDLPGSGNLKLTGQMGGVMSESA